MDVCRCSVSLFSGGGIGDLGVQYGAEIPVIALSELLEDRADVLRKLFPDASVHQGDIWTTKDAIVESVRSKIGNLRPFMLVMSPPCQGMSSNGAGRISSAVTRGTRPAVDERNRLAVPALDVAEQLQPEWIIMENVRNMGRTTILNEHDENENILDMVRRRLPNYTVYPKVLNAADYGVPQIRHRLITICCRHGPSIRDTPFHPPMLPKQISIHAVTAHLSRLDALTACQDPNDLLHRIPPWTKMQHFCMAHTREGETAFDNDSCVECGTHHTDAHATTCETCGARLPRPQHCVQVWSCCGLMHNSKQKTCKICMGPAPTTFLSATKVIKAFKTSYRRMNGDRPASTLTTNSGVISSDVKGHPTQHRVLSTREVLIVSSVGQYPGFVPKWRQVLPYFEELSDRLIRHILGESIPPLLMQRIVQHILCQQSELGHPLVHLSELPKEAASAPRHDRRIAKASVSSKSRTRNP